MKGAVAATALRIAWFGAVALAFVGPGVFSDSVPAFRDFLVLVVPMRFAAARAMAMGDLPLWTPDLFLGAPFLANYQSAVFYPPSILIYVAPEPLGISLFLGFHIALAGLGTAAFLRERERLPAGAALFGGTVYAAGGFFASLLPLTNHCQAAAWLPWILLAGHRLRDKSDALCFMTLSLLLAVQLLCGAPETTLLSWLLLISSSTITALSTAHRKLVVSGLQMASIALAIGLTAFQLVPTLEYARETDRSDRLPLETAAAESIALRSLQQVVLPNTFSHGAPNLTTEGGVPLFWSLYVGAATLAAVVAIRPSAYWVIVAVISLSFALANDLPVFRLAYQVAPGVLGLFRYPGKFFIATHLAIVLIAARGLACALESDAARRRFLWAAGVLATLALLTVAALGAAPQLALASLGYELRGGLDDRVYSYVAAGTSLSAIRLVVLAAVAGGAAYVAGSHPRFKAAAVAVLILTTGVDLVALHRPIMGYMDEASLGGPTSLAGLRPGNRTFHYCLTGFGCKPGGAAGLGIWRGTLRVGVSIQEQAGQMAASLVPNLPMLRGIGSVAGSDGFETQRQRELARALVVVPPEAGARLLGAYGVRALIGREPFEISAKLGEVRG